MMFYTIIWVLLWLTKGETSFTIGTPMFFALVVAIIADVFWYGFWHRDYLKRV